MSHAWRWISSSFMRVLLAHPASPQRLVPPPPGGGNCLSELCRVYTELHFSSMTSGYAYDGGGLFRATDGGATWVPVLGPASATRLSGGELFFVSDSTFFVMREGLRRTTDSGVTFATLSTTVPSNREPGATDRLLSGFFFLDANHGWGRNSESVVIMTDGGVTWTPFDMRPRMEPPAKILMFDAQSGLGVGFRELLRTENGGRAWNRIANAPEMRRVRCTRNGFCMGTNFPDPVAYISSDQGQTWQATQTGIDSEKDQVHDVVPVPGGGAVAVGGHEEPGVVLRNWDLRTPLPPLPTPVPGVAFVLRWNGSAWQRTDYPEIDDLWTAQFVTATDVWASADKNGLLKSSDGGQTWTVVPDYYRQIAALTPTGTPLVLPTPPPTQ